MMKIKKVILFAATIFAAILTFTSCIIEEGSGRPKATLPGVIVFENAEKNISGVIELADLALKMDKYINAPETEKAGIAAKYFPGYVLSFGTGQWTIKTQYNEYTIKPDGKSIQTVGAKWIAKKEHPSYAYDSAITPLLIEVECTGNETWKISTPEQTGYNVYFIANYTVSGNSVETSNPISLYEYTVSGSGNYEPDVFDNGQNFFHISYTINTPMKLVHASNSATGAPAHFISIRGKIEIMVSDDLLSSSLDHIIVELLSQTPSGVTKIVTFNSTTEIWDN